MESKQEENMLESERKWKWNERRNKMRKGVFESRSHNKLALRLLYYWGESSVFTQLKLMEHKSS